MPAANPTSAAVAGKRVTAGDLAFACNWLASYEPNDEDGDDNDERVQRLLAWLNAEIERRAKDALVREAARRNGVSVSTVRKALAARRTGAPA